MRSPRALALLVGLAAPLTAAAADAAAIDGAADAVGVAADRLQSQVALASRAAPPRRAGSPSGGPRMCTWNGSCAVSDDWDRGLAEQLPEGSAVRGYMEQSRTCQSLRAPDRCSGASGCTWDALADKCEVTEKLGVLVGSRFGSPESCGFLAHIFAAATCRSRPTDACTVNSTCQVQNRSLGVPDGAGIGTECEVRPVCTASRSANAIVMDALCGKGYNQTDAVNQCRHEFTASGGHIAAFVECMNKSCQVVGELWEAALAASCDNFGTGERCNGRPDCLWRHATQSCQFDGSRVLLKEVPDRCPAKRELTMDTECLHKTPGACRDECLWTEDLECDGIGLVAARGSCSLDDRARMQAVAEDSNSQEAALLAKAVGGVEACGRARSEAACANATLPAPSSPRSGGGASAPLFP